jgi:hypothetical protein
MAGYSGTPLAKKLGIVEGNKVVTTGAPKDYMRLLEPLPEGVQFPKRISAATDVVHVFSTQREELRSLLKSYRQTLKPTAAVWVSWPKKSAKLETDVTEDTIRELALPLGFVDIKVCAVTDIWSGLKLVVRKELR